MKPDKAGIWEWFKEDGTKVLVEVCNVGAWGKPWLRVYWWGGYYNVNDETATSGDKGPFYQSQWADRWGNYVGTNGSVPEDKLYSMPTPEEREKMMKKV